MMKTTIKTTALFLATILLTINVSAAGLEFDQENYINDIPSNIEVVIDQITYENAVSIEFSIDEEEYIDDIPAEINNNSNQEILEFSFDEEDYINDIPSELL